MAQDLFLAAIQVYPPTADQIDRARKAVCHFADDAKEAELFLRMLGLLDV